MAKFTTAHVDGGHQANDKSMMPTSAAESPALRNKLPRGKERIEQPRKLSTLEEVEGGSMKLIFTTFSFQILAVLE